jgi:predicted GIY-YIG superfamily endonuclease
MHFVYIVRCADGSLYTGYARDPRARARAHNAGRGARYTCGRRPVRLVYSEPFESLSAALKREYELKQWTRAQKQALVTNARRSRFTANRRPRRPAAARAPR